MNPRTEYQREYYRTTRGPRERQERAARAPVYWAQWLIDQIRRHRAEDSCALARRADRRRRQHADASRRYRRRQSLP